MNSIRKMAGWIAGLVFVLGLVLIAFFPVSNRALRVEFRFDTAAAAQSCHLSLADGTPLDGVVNGNTLTLALTPDQSENITGALTLSFDSAEPFALHSCTVYRDGMDVFQYSGSALVPYLDSSQGFASIEPVNNTLEATFLPESTGGQFAFVAELVQKIAALSHSVLEERLLGILLWAALAIWVLLIRYLIRDFREAQPHGNNVRAANPLRKFCQDIYKYGYYMTYSAKADLKAEVANSYLNWFWWILEPFCNMLVYVIVFSNIMGTSIAYYPVFTFSSLLMWNFFNKTINYSVKAVRNNRDIVSRVYVPKFVLLMSNMILNFFKLLFSLVVLLGLLIVFRVPISPQMLWVFVCYAELILVSFGIGMIFMHFGVFIDDLSYAVGIALNMMMFLSGVFYDLPTSIGAPLNQLLLWFNPVALLIDTMRSALLYGQISNLPAFAAWFVLSLGLCGLGVCIVYKNENGYVKVV